jgi:hypothetical protein
MKPSARPSTCSASAALLLASALSLAGPACAPMQALVTPHDDYAAYRATRLAGSFDDRLAAAHLYLNRFPEGDYAAQVRAYFDEAEPIFYAAKRGSVSGLEAYLRALPKGPRSEQVLEELRELRAAKSAREDLRQATSMGARLSVLASQRVRVRTEIEAWLRRFLDQATWTRSIRDAPDDFIVAWSLGLPAPVCRAPDEGAPPEHARRCSKILELPYMVTADGQPEERQATIEISLIEDAAGRPLEVTIGGPDLFLRVEETYSARGISREDTAKRASAATRAVDLVRREFEERIGIDPDCRRPPAAPILLHFACKGLRVTVRSPVAGGEDDAISISRFTPRPSSP